MHVMEGQKDQDKHKSKCHPMHTYWSLGVLFDKNYIQQYEDQPENELQATNMFVLLEFIIKLVTMSLYNFI